MATPVCGRTPVFVITNFYMISPLISLGEGDPVLVEKRKEPIEGYLNALDVCNGVTYVGFVIS